MRMTADVDLFGVFIPALVFAVIAAFVLLSLLRNLLVKIRFYRWVAYRDLFDLSLFFIVLAVLLFVFGGPVLTPLFG